MPEPCAFCGHPDFRHRIVDSMWEQMYAGDPIDDVLADYGFSLREFVELSVEVGE